MSRRRPTIGESTTTERRRTDEESDPPPREGLIRKELRPTRFALAAAVVAASQPGQPAPGGAAHPARAHERPRVQEKFKQPKLEHGLLSIVGTEAGDAITLRLGGDPARSRSTSETMARPTLPRR
jgi:hypothetical protein